MLYPVDLISMVRICPLEHAIDDNMGSGVAIFDKAREAVFVRPNPDLTHWRNIETNQSYRKVGPEIVPV